jgi:hypothetical protein
LHDIGSEILILRDSLLLGMANAVNRSAAQSRRRSPPPRPLPEGVVDRGHRYTLAQRIQCLTLIAHGLSTTEVEQQTGVKSGRIVLACNNF